MYIEVHEKTGPGNPGQGCRGIRSVKEASKPTLKEELGWPGRRVEEHSAERTIALWLQVRGGSRY